MSGGAVRPRFAPSFARGLSEHAAFWSVLAIVAVVFLA